MTSDLRQTGHIALENKRPRRSVCLFTCKVLLCFSRFTLAEEEARNVSRASVPYAPLYDHLTFLSALAHFRDAERRSLEATDLFTRGAERVVHNISLFEDEVRTDTVPAAPRRQCGRLPSLFRTLPL